MLWTLRHVAHVCGAPFGGINNEIQGVSIDSRTLADGDLFVALKGDNDGHSYLQSALEKGAAGLLVDHIPDGVSADACVVVPDTLKALESLAIDRRNECSARCIAVTGSVGKTGTKDMLALLLSAYGAVHKSVKSYNNHWGVPLTLARMPVETEYGVFEAGMNHAGELTVLSQMIQPDVAIVTHVVESHIGHFDSLDGIAAAKSEIFAGLKPGGVAIVNRDNPYFDFLAFVATHHGAGTIIGFGHHVDSDVRIVSVKTLALGSEVHANVCGEDVAYTLPVPGEHWVMNSLAVLAAIHGLGLDVRKALGHFQNVTPPEGRGVISTIKIGSHSCTLIDESYNANPASMRAALNVLKTTPASRRIAVIGDMRELGIQADTLHQGLLPDLEGIDLVLASGPHMKGLFDLLPEHQQTFWSQESREIIDPLLQVLKEGDVVMVKGSLGTRMAPIVEALKAQKQKEVG